MGLVGGESPKASWKQILKSCSMVKFDVYPMAKWVV